MRTGAPRTAGLDARHTQETARVLHGLREAALAGGRPELAARPVIDASWQRMFRAGIDPEQDTRSVLLGTEELEHRRRATQLSGLLPTLSQELAPAVDASMQVMVVTDAEGRVLWRSGNRATMRKADRICLAEGAAWSEGATGTNAVGTVLATGRAVQVHSAEHFVRTLRNWTCAAAPIHDPRDGRLIGVLDVSGPDSTFHPAMLALVDSVARLATAELQKRHLVTVDRLRSVGSPILSRVGGRALVVDAHGWPAAVTGMPPTDRLPLPKSFAAGRVWLPSLGMCTVEPLPGGWLIRLDEEGTEPGGGTPTSRVVLDLSGRRRWSVTVSGASGSWTQELTPRHAELLYVLSLHREGRTAAELADGLFGDATRTVTVRAEMSRVRRRLAEILAHRPYRFAEGVEVEVIRPADPTDLLPHSTAPAVRGPGTPP
ncbi:helix-turn-helix domain-containing protein [Streptomyces sp. NBC_01766]|uniref:helix-turn-helix domain-containing protein n=1 Tax=Streptomyces sp. NBC_01766 TaxID=2975936 RepID=UPI002DDC8ECC|nr:GAF domain-containing protein [Streptomyces sp. NBC_01766]WSC19104.1 GAF domain-containing protein [Streptomyces sp. NBC_01766]